MAARKCVSGDQQQLVWGYTHVLDVDDGVWLAARECAIGEGVGCDDRCSSAAAATIATSLAALIASASISTSSLETSATSSIATATAEAAAAVATLLKASAESTAATETASSSAETATSAKSWARVCIAVLANLKNAALPVVAVEGLNGVLCVFWCVESDDS